MQSNHFHLLQTETLRKQKRYSKVQINQFVILTNSNPEMFQTLVRNNPVNKNTENYHKITNYNTMQELHRNALRGVSDHFSSMCLLFWLVWRVKQ